jgi:ABC-type multidrug transport system permease subunit
MLHRLSKLGLYLPHLYFMSVVIIIAMNPNFAMIAIAIFLFAMIFIKNKILNVAVAAFMLFFSFWMGLAYLSDFHKIMEFDNKTWQFVLVGGLFVFTNFFMAILMGLPFFKEQVDLSQEDLSILAVRNSI